jgi:hypothetical protein
VLNLITYRSLSSINIGVSNNQNALHVFQSFNCFPIWGQNSHIPSKLSIFSNAPPLLNWSTQLKSGGALLIKGKVTGSHCPGLWICTKLFKVGSPTLHWAAAALIKNTNFNPRPFYCVDMRLLKFHNTSYFLSHLAAKRVTTFEPHFWLPYLKKFVSASTLWRMAKCALSSSGSFGWTQSSASKTRTFATKRM